MNASGEEVSSLDPLLFERIYQKYLPFIRLEVNEMEIFQQINFETTMTGEEEKIT